MSGPQKFFAGVGKSGYDTVRGLGQLVGVVDDDEANENAKLDASLMNTGAGITGNIGGQVAQMIVPGGAALKGAKAVGAVKSAPYLAAALSGGAYAASQPVVGDQSRAGNAAFGAAAGLGGQAVGAGLARVAKGASDTISPATKALFEKAKAAGIPVTAAQLSDSRFVKALASVVDRLPWSGAAKRQASQQGAFNAAVGKTFGAEGNKLTTEVMGAAKAKLGATFDRLGSAYGVKVDDELLGRLAGIADEATRLSPDNAGSAVSNVIDDILSKTENGTLPGKAYQSFNTKLRELAKTKDRYGGYVGQVRDAMEDALTRSIPAAEKELYKTARSQYASMKTAEKVAQTRGGDVTPAALSHAARGRGELGELAEIGQRFVRQTVPDSGTAERNLLYSALGGGAAYGGMIEPTTAALLVGSGKILGAPLHSKMAAQYMAYGIPGLRTAVPAAAKAAPSVATAETERRRKRKASGLLD